MTKMRKVFRANVCILLTLAIVAGLLVTAVPVSAGNLTWDYWTVPSATTSTFQITQNTNASLFAIAPDGETIFAYSRSWTGIPANTGLYKSDDAGVNWTNTNVGNSLPTGVVALAVSPNYATDTTVMAATATQLWRSRNGGQDWLIVVIAPIALTAPIVSVDIAPYYVSSGSTALLIATRNEIALYSDDLGWRIITRPTFTVGPSAGQPTNFAPGFILTARFSPTYQTDGEILAVVTNVAAGQIGLSAAGTVLETLFEDNTWNYTAQPAQLTLNQSPSSNQPFVANVSTATAALAFPSDYNSSSSTLNRVYVTVGTSNNVLPIGVWGFDVWRVDGSINSSGTVVNGTQLLLTESTFANNASIAYTGTAASGTLVVGEYGNGGVWWATTPNGTPTWTQASGGFVPGLNVGKDVFVTFPPPAGANPSTLYAATNNNIAGWGSAFFTSTDYNNYKAISLISVPDLSSASKLTFSAPTGLINGTNDQYMLMTYNKANPVTVLANDIQMVFKSSDNGATWAEVFGLLNTVPGNTAPPLTVVGQALNGIFPSPTYATDSTVYVTQTFNLIWKSSDRGATWHNYPATTPNNSISAFAPIDANSYWLGSTGGGLYKSGSYTQVATLDGTIPFQIFLLPFAMIINTWTGEVYVSTDSGATFTRLGSALQFSNGGIAGPGGTYFNDRASLTFDVPTKTIYAANSTSTANNHIYKWTVGTDTAWVDWATVTYTPTGDSLQTPIALSSISLAEDGTLYIRVPNDVAGTTFQLLRSVDFLTAPQGQATFVGIPGTTSSAADFGNGAGNNLPGGRSTWIVTDATAQTNPIYQIVSSSAVPAGQTGFPAVIKTYIDTLTGKATVTAPKDKDQIPPYFTFAWNPIPSPQQVTYQVQIATDNQFNGLIPLPSGGPNNIPGQTTSISMYVNGLIPGTQYYFRVSAVLPLPSKWSDTIPFSVRLNIPDNLSPVSGAINVPLTPPFQWLAVVGADRYDFKLGLNSSFLSPIDSKTDLTANTYLLTTPLQSNTTYFWEVRAVNGPVSSDWVVSYFTTVNIGTPAKLAFMTQPAGAIANTSFTSQPAVAVQDPGGNIATSSSAPITLTITTGTGASGSVLSGTTTVNAVNGVATFSGLSIDKAGANYTLTATSSGLTPAIGQAFNVTVGAPPYSAGSGGGGGGGSPPPVIKALTINGLKSSADLKIDNYGNIQSAAQLATEDGNVTLAIPKNAKLVDANGKALETLSTGKLSSLPEPPPQAAIVAAYEFGPDGAQFSPPLTLTLKYDPRSLPSSMNGNEVSLAFWDGSKWVMVEGTLDASTNTLTAQISHFTQYALLAELSPAKFTLSDIKITEDKSQEDDPVTIQTVITNEGGCRGQFNANLTLNSFRVNKQEVTLDAGKSQTVNFVLKNLMPGKYIVGINEKNSQFIIEAPTKTTAEPSPIPEPTTAALTPMSVTETRAPVPPLQEKSSAPVAWILLGVIIIVALVSGIIIIRRREKHS